MEYVNYHAEFSGRSNSGMQVGQNQGPMYFDATSSDIQIAQNFGPINVSQVVGESKEAAQRRLRESLLVWLTKDRNFHGQDPTDLANTFSNHGWLTNGTEYAEWLKAPPWRLCCYGKPGSGKTVLCSQIKRKLQDDFKDALVLGLFLDPSNSPITTLDLICTLVVQLVRRQTERPLSGRLHRMLDDGNRFNSSPNPKDLIEVLKEEFKNYPKVFLIVDAWNEVPSDITRELESALQDLIDGSNNVCTLVTDRTAEGYEDRHSAICAQCKEEPKIYKICNKCEDVLCCERCIIEQEFSCGKKGHSMVYADRVELLLNPEKDEVCQYIEWEIDRFTGADSGHHRTQRRGASDLSQTPLERAFEEFPDLRQELPAAIAMISPGEFRKARMHIKVIELMPSVQRIRDSVNRLPEGLTEVYEAMLEEFKQLQPKKAAEPILDAFYWIAAGKMILTFPMLRQALDMAVGGVDYAPTYGTRKQDLMMSSKRLIFPIDGGMGMDQGLQWWLRGNLTQLPGRDLEVAKKLLTCLNYPALIEPCLDDEAHVLERLHAFPLLEYAAQFWAHHVIPVSDNEEVYNLLLEFLKDSGKIASTIQICYLRGLNANVLDVRKGVNGLHLAAFYGIDRAIRDLLDYGLDVNSGDPIYNQTALMYACRQGHLSTVRLLLEKGASADVWSRRCGHALFDAYMGQHHDTKTRQTMTKLILDIPTVNPNIRCEAHQHMTLLMLAAQNEDDGMIQLLLQRTDIQVNAKDSEGRTALIRAVIQQHRRITGLLINHHGSRLDILTKEGETAISEASKFAGAKIASDLLDAEDEKFREADAAHRRALFNAVEAGNIEVMRLFLDRHFKVQVRDENGRTLLHIAAKQGNTELVQLLIDTGKFDLDAVDARFSTPLHYASRLGRPEVVKTLLGQHADHYMKDAAGRTALDVARQNAWTMPHYRVMKLLAQRETSNTQIREQVVSYQTTLPTWSLVRLQLKSELQRRLEHPEEWPPSRLLDQDPDTGNTALHFAVEAPDASVLSLLLEANAIPQDMTNHMGETPLYIASRLGDYTRTQTLLRHPLDVRAAASPTSFSLSTTTASAKARKIDPIGTGPGLDPLSCAQRAGNFDVAVALVSAGARLDPADRTFLQPTFVRAIILEDMSATARLLQAGADMLVTDDDFERRPLQLAQDLGNPDMLKLMDRQKSFFVGVDPPVVGADDNEDEAPGLNGFWASVTHGVANMWTLPYVVLSGWRNLALVAVPKSN